MKFEDLTDEQFEDLGEKMYEDEDLINNFVIDTYDGFDSYTGYEGNGPGDYDLDTKIRYCESRDHQFILFAFEKYYGGK